ncbi:MAG: hypothetical protein JXA96_15700 [Sedimentisphaerales bacterium]|nr:hypothetical protein [Sedimentisphaerales bacterium]
MVKHAIGLKFLVVLSFLAIIAGCSKNNDEVESLKKQLTKTQEDLDYWQGRYDALAADLRNAKASQRNLGTQLNSVDGVSQSIEEQLQIYAQQITNFQVQIQQLNTVVTEQEAIINEQEAIIIDQEAALQELMGGITDQTPYY